MKAAIKTREEVGAAIEAITTQLRSEAYRRLGLISDKELSKAEDSLPEQWMAAILLSDEAMAGAIESYQEEALGGKWALTAGVKATKFVQVSQSNLDAVMQEVSKAAESGSKRVVYLEQRAAPEPAQEPVEDDSAAEG